MTLLRSTGQVQRRFGKSLASADIVGANRNVLSNGCFRVAQRGTTIDASTTYPNSDGGYCLDRWLIVSDGDDRADITQETSVVPDGSYAAIKFDVETVGAPSEKFGICQIIEARDTARLWKNQTGVVSLSFKARTTSSVVENLRVAVLAWTGAADTITTAGDNTDFLSAWGAEGDDPTWDASLTLENVADTDYALGNTYATYSIENILLDTAGTTNLVVFFWVDDTDLIATNVFYLADVQLEPGPYATPFEQRTFDQELARCQRFFQKTFDQGTAPVQNAGTANGAIGALSGTDATELIGQWRFPVTMRAVPSITYYNPAAADTKWNDPDTADTASATYDVGDSGLLATNSDAVPAANDRCFIHATADAEL